MRGIRLLAAAIVFIHIHEKIVLPTVTQFEKLNECGTVNVQTSLSAVAESQFAFKSAVEYSSACSICLADGRRFGFRLGEPDSRQSGARDVILPCTAMSDGNMRKGIHFPVMLCFRLFDCRCECAKIK